MGKTRWTNADIPSLRGKNAIVTGANIGLGLEIAAQLALHGAHVILACRNPTKAAGALKDIEERLAKVPEGGSAETMQVDCASLKSVKAFCEAVKAKKLPSLDILVCNAGIMAPGEWTKTEDGFEVQFGVNVLSHFAMVEGLLPQLEATPGSRVVHQSSSGNYIPSSVPFDDLNFSKSTWTSTFKYQAYGMSKLGNILFSNELDRRLRAAGKANPTSIAVHPGLVIGQLQEQATSSWWERVTYPLIKTLGLSQTYELGALPALYAATSPDAKGGKFYGPDGISNGSLGGYPIELQPNKLALDPEIIRKYFDECEKLTAVKYKL
ncbi:short-chain dehydrogenase/reductase SDR [Hyaloraphidium curvatum]|nr:short-chain dehydrogenase/reductase SDR [Hyaloraphidium curvatum]